MRIFISLLLFSLLSTASSEIRFEEVSQQAGINRIGESWGNAWGDFDGDGYLDLWATNHRHKPSLYLNNRDGTFTNIIDEVWDANPLADTHGVAWADFDNDGDQDLFLLSGAGGGSGNYNHNHDNHFYINENGLLVERAAEFGVDYPYLRGRTPLWFDADLDGLLDLLLLGDVGMDREGNTVPSGLFKQTMTGFENISTSVGFLRHSAKLAQYADITADGNMEIILSNQTYPIVIYDTSGGIYKDLVGTLDLTKGTSVHDGAVADFNGDLRPDFFVARSVYQSTAIQVNPTRLELDMRNNKDEKGVRFKTEGEVDFIFYSEWGPQAPLVKIGANGNRVTTFHNGRYQSVIPTRRTAIYEVTLSPDDPRVIGLKQRTTPPKYAIHAGFDPSTKTWTIIYKLPAATTVVEAEKPIEDLETINFSYTDMREQPVSQLMFNTGFGFQVANTTSEVNAFENGNCVAAGDFDNDMDVDLYLVRSYSGGNLPNHLYENKGNGTFIKHTNAGGANGSIHGQGQSVTMADYDIDGYLDLFVTNGRGAYPVSEGPDQLFHNIGVGNNWLQIDLEGKVSNRDGIGARLFATTPDGKTQLRENGGGTHWAQQDQKRIHFGLAQNEKVSELLIYWPSGLVQKLKDVEINQVLHVVEEGTEKLDTGDVNLDGRVDILDLLLIVAHFGESPPSNRRYDTNKDRTVDLQDVVYVIEIIQNEDAAAPATNRGINFRESYTLTDRDMALLSVFYEIIEELSTDTTQITLVKRFIEKLLGPANGPLVTKLHSNYPNPFNPETWVPYQLSKDSHITIRIYNLTGEIVRTVYTGHQESGYYLTREKAAHWDGRNEVGESVASGVYIYELETPTFKQTRRLVIIK